MALSAAHPRRSVSTLDSFFVQADYPFHSTDESSLSFEQGDVIEVLTRLDSGWWDGLIGDRRGWFPSNYVRVITDEEAEEWLIQQEEEMSRDLHSSRYSHGPDGLGLNFNQLSVRSSAILSPLHSHSHPSTGPSPGARGVVGDDADEEAVGLDALAREMMAFKENSQAITKSQVPTPGSHQELFFKPSPNGHRTSQQSSVSKHGSEKESETEADFWVPSLTEDGQIYYHNTRTGEESWDPPFDDPPTPSTGGSPSIDHTFSGPSRLSLYLDATNRVHTQLLPPTLNEDDRLMALLRLIDSEVNGVLQHAEKCANDEPHALAESVQSLLPAIRSLVITCRQTVIGLSRLIDSPLSSSYAANERIHPAQRRVVAALSKVVFFCHSAVGTSWPMPGSLERLAADTVELHGAIQIFVRELYRYGCLAEGGLGLRIEPYLSTTPSSSPDQDLPLDLLVRLDAEYLSNPSIDTLSPLLDGLLRFDTSILDLDGHDAQGGLAGLHALHPSEDAMAARQAYYRFERAMNDLEDSSGKALLHGDHGLPKQTPVPHLLRLFDLTHRRSTSLHSETWRDRTPKSASESQSQSFPEPPSPASFKRPGLNRSMTSFDSLNPLSKRNKNGSMSASSSMTSLSESLSKRSSFFRAIPMLRNRSTSEVSRNGRSSPLPTSGSRKKLAQMLGADEERLIAPPKPFYLEPDYTSDDLVMHADGSVKAGTLPALVERLTQHDSMDPTFNATFLLTYRSFADPADVVKLLRERYLIKPPDLEPDQLIDWQEHKQKPIKLRVFNTFKTWIDQHYVEPETMAQIEDFVTVMQDDTQLQMPTPHLIRSIERRRHSEGVIARRLTAPIGSAPAAIIPRIPSKGLRVTDINPVELARQLTILESKLYNKIRPEECLHKAWSQTDDPESGANIKAMILTSNRIAGWVAETILMHSDVKRRAGIMKHFIQTAEHCRSINNFSSMAAIMAGLNSTPIIRLKRTRNALSQKMLVLMDDLDKTLDSGRNFASYRERLKRIEPPCIPFLGVFLTYLTVLEENSDTITHPSMPDRKLINFFKRHRSAEIIRDIQQYQAMPYNLSVIEPVQRFIKSNLEAVDRAPDLYDVSLRVEPREREDEKLARVLRESGMI